MRTGGDRPAAALWGSLFLTSLLLVGCEKGPEIGVVQGTVTLDGKPLDMVRVVFMPDPNEATHGAHSECVTDGSGKYDLLYSQALDVRGAIVGWHRVIVEEIAAEESREQFRAIRVPDRYRMAAQTPLKFEVKPGEQSIDIELQTKGER